MASTHTFPPMSTSLTSAVWHCLSRRPGRFWNFHFHITGSLYSHVSQLALFFVSYHLPCLLFCYRKRLRRRTDCFPLRNYRSDQNGIILPLVGSKHEPMALLETEPSKDFRCAHIKVQGSGSKRVTREYKVLKRLPPSIEPSFGFWNERPTNFPPATRSTSGHPLIIAFKGLYY